MQVGQSGQDSQRSKEEQGCTPAGDADGALGHGGQHLLSAEGLGDVLGHAKALQTGERKQGGLHAALLQLADAGLHVAAEVLHLCAVQEEGGGGRVRREGSNTATALQATTQGKTALRPCCEGAARAGKRGQGRQRAGQGRPPPAPSQPAPCRSRHRRAVGQHHASAAARCAP
jgi:hypothetical protein